MSYEKHTWTNNETITAAKLNNIEDGITEAAQSGGDGYDLVISNTNTSHYFGDMTVSDLSIDVGDILSCEEKLINGETVSALFIMNGAWSSIPSGRNTNLCAKYLTLTDFQPPYPYLRFTSLLFNGAEAFATYVTVFYDTETGDITDVASNYMMPDSRRRRVRHPDSDR